MKWFSRHILLIALVVLYLGMHVVSLTKLPVFADEAIYIHWAQEAIRLPSQYAFLPMLDGKPPLHVWMMIPFLFVFRDPLFAGRFFSVLVGLATMLVMMGVVRLLGGGKREQVFSALFVLFAPFWMFYHRMALAESLLALFFLLGLFFAIRIVLYGAVRDMLGFALFFGAALWTKTTALFFVPVYGLTPFLMDESKRVKQWWPTVGKLMFSGAIGFGIFLLLKISPLFPFLFTRSADYTFSIAQVLGGEWRYVISHSVWTVLFWLLLYLTPFLLFLACFAGRKRWVLWLMIAVFMAPLIIFGKVLYSRYFLPAAALLTILASLGAGRALNHEKTRSFARTSLFLFFAVSLVNTILLVTRPESALYALQDKHQYLIEWSAGYGIPEARTYFEQRLRERDLTVGTEGYFGTLPDGLSIYFFGKTFSHDIRIFGVGEPIKEIPQILLQEAKTRETYLLVNEYRFFVNDNPHMQRVASYPRPFGATPLLLIRIVP